MVCIMWEDSFCIGVDEIDKQHKELFDKVGELITAINKSVEKHKKECIEAILFLKNYAVTHFAAEEAYQESIGYPYFDAHKEQHVKFIQTVLNHEKKMLESDFAESDVKSFAGTLTAWLLYHVADSDQQIGRYAAQTETDTNTDSNSDYSHGDIVGSSVCDVLQKMAGLDNAAMKKTEAHDGVFDENESVIIKVELTVDISGWLAFVYPSAFIKNLVHSMMGFKPEVIDELALSVIFELSNIISGTVCGQIAVAKGIFCDIKTPSAVQRSDISPDESVALDTGIGIIVTEMVINYK